MTETNVSVVRGWCPGALRPMESGDGLIVRIHTRSGALSCADLQEIAGIAQRYGNGLIDLTRRANIQIRGVNSETIGDLHVDLSALGLLDATPQSEAVRNVMVSPLAGIDPTEPCDLRPIAWELEHHLENDPALWQLPGKFGFIVDGGGSLSLDHERADIRIKGVLHDGEPMAAIGIDTDIGIDWIAAVLPEVAADSALRIARGYLELRGNGDRARIREFPASLRAQLHALVADPHDALSAVPAHEQRQAPLGILDHEGAVYATGLAVPFGRIEAGSLSAFTRSAAALGVTDFRLSPWRALYAVVFDQTTAEQLVGTAQAHDFIIDSSDPLRAIDACPGAPACLSSTLDTRTAARCLAPLLGELGCRSLHVSGCSKGCARSKPADLVLVGAGDRFGIVRNGTTRDEPGLFVGSEEIAQLPNILEKS